MYTIYLTCGFTVSEKYFKKNFKFCLTDLVQGSKLTERDFSGP